MTIESYYEQLFKYATGWLGWEPEIALNTPVGQIELALDGKMDFLKKTNPFGSSKEDEDDKRLAEASTDPKVGMQKLLNLVKRRQAHDARQGKKPKR